MRVFKATLHSGNCEKASKCTVSCHGNEPEQFSSTHFHSQLFDTLTIVLLLAEITAIFGLNIGPDFRNAVTIKTEQINVSPQTNSISNTPGCLSGTPAYQVIHHFNKPQRLMLHLKNNDIIVIKIFFLKNNNKKT